jgi:STE24 endopeptidase
VNEDRASRYHRLKRQSGVVSLLWTVALLLTLTLTSGSLALRGAAEAIAPQGVATSVLVVIIYVTLLSLIHEIGKLPFDFYGGFLLERRYGMSTQTFTKWCSTQAKGTALGVALAMAAASLVYGCIRLWPANWWLPAGLVFAVLVVGLAHLAPVLLLPMFYRITPLQQASLRARLMTLAERAGARVLGAYEWGLSADTKKANAALAGLGSTRRILVSDTMLADYSDDEIEVVLAHELAHHVHGDIWKGLLFESGLLVAGFYAAAWALRAFAAPAGLSGVADVAGLPLLLLAAGGVSLLMLPLAHAVSRAHERKADRFALELTRNPAAFMSAMRRLGAQSLAEEHPSRLVQWLFYSHPPMRERIAAAKQFAG